MLSAFVSGFVSGATNVSASHTNYQPKPPVRAIDRKTQDVALRTRPPTQQSNAGRQKILTGRDIESRAAEDRNDPRGRADNGRSPSRNSRTRSPESRAKSPPKDSSSRGWSDLGESIANSHAGRGAVEIALGAGCAASGDIQGALEHYVNASVECAQGIVESFTKGVQK